MAYELKGKIDSMDDAQTFGTFTKREFCIVTEEGKYPQTIKLECVQDGVSKLDNVNVGDEVDIRFDIRGRRIDDGRVFNSLVAWAVKVVSGAAKTENAPSADSEAASAADGDELPMGEDLDSVVPF